MEKLVPHERSVGLASLIFSLENETTMSGTCVATHNIVESLESGQNKLQWMNTGYCQEETILMASIQSS